jgi:hypothetical protein
MIEPIATGQASLIAELQERAARAVPAAVYVRYTGGDWLRLHDSSGHLVGPAPPFCTTPQLPPLMSGSLLPRRSMSHMIRLPVPNLSRLPARPRRGAVPPRLPAATSGEPAGPDAGDSATTSTERGVSSGAAE